MSNMVVSRFNNETYERNLSFRTEKGVGCIYGTPFPINTIGPNEVVFVVEMNVEENQVEGIGIILNIVKTGKKYEMYNDYNFNRYVYCGKYHLSREEIEMYRDDVEDTDPLIPQINILEILDTVLFKGKSHLKRGSHYHRITDKLLARCGTTAKKVQDFIKKMFMDVYDISIIIEEELDYDKYGL